MREPKYLDVTKRHPSTQHVMQYFDFDHLPDPLRSVSASCAALAVDMVDLLPDGPELTAGLRKLLEAKDCLVRASLELKEERR